MRGSSHEAPQAKKSLFSRGVSKMADTLKSVATSPKKLTESILNNTRARMAALGILSGLATAKGAEASVADMVNQDRSKVEPSAFVIKDNARVETRANIFQSGDNIGASASIAHISDTDAFGIAAAGTKESQNAKVAFAGKYAGGVVSADALVNNSTYKSVYEQGEGDLQGFTIGASYDYLIGGKDGNTSVNVRAERSQTFDSNLATESASTTQNRIVENNGVRDTYADTTTTETARKYEGGGVNRASLEVTSLLSDNLAISGGTTYTGKSKNSASSITGQVGVQYADGVRSVVLSAQDLGARDLRDPIYSASVDHKIGASSSLGVFASVREGKSEDATVGIRATHRWGGGNAVPSRVASLTSLTPEGSLRSALSGATDLSSISYRDLGSVKSYTTSSVSTNLLKREFLSTITPATPQVSVKQGESVTTTFTVRSVDGAEPTILTTNGLRAIVKKTLVSRSSPAQVSFAKTLPNTQIYSATTLSSSAFPDATPKADAVSSTSTEEVVYIVEIKAAEDAQANEKVTIELPSGEQAQIAVTVESTTPEVTDTTAPTITITGPKVITLTQGDTFVMPEVTASDAIDGVVEVKIEGSIDTTKVGTQTLKLSATDQAGNIGADTISVTVKAKEIVDTLAPSKVSEDLPGIDFAGAENITGTITLSEAVDRVIKYRYVDSAGLSMIGFQGGALTVSIDPSDAKKLVLNYTVPFWQAGNPMRIEVDVADKAGNAATIVTQGYNVN